MDESRFYQKYFKRFFDVIFSIICIIIAAPIMVILYILIHLFLDSTAIFKQKRIGQHSNPFIIYKFRTMKDICDLKGQPLSDNERLTKFGVFLRSTSLDELPQLFNVLKGDMSIIGPRPNLEEFLPHYTSNQAQRHDIKPGITGWAQVNGRNQLSWEEKFSLDIWYKNNISFCLDIKILWRTFLIVCNRHGISAPSHPTMPRFTGSKTN